MAYYRQSAASPKLNATHGSSSGANYGRNEYPRSHPAMGPALIPPGMETPTRWTPFGTFAPQPYFGGWDALGGRLMHVTQADSYNAINPWPANGVDDYPNAAPLAILRMAPTTSVHRGFQNPTGPSPTMLFHAPPIFGLQTVPIPAVGT